MWLLMFGLELMAELQTSFGFGPCGEPPPVPNTYRAFPDSTTVLYTCLDNYLLTSGNLSHVCVDGKWNGLAPVCEFNCGPPLNSSYGVINGSDSQAGSVLAYICPDDSITLSSITSCRVDDMWTKGDGCYRNQSLDMSSFEVKQSSTATYKDLYGRAWTGLDEPTFDAINAIDNNTKPILAEGGCSSTQKEQNPSITITTDIAYNMYQVIITFPEAEVPPPNLKIEWLRPNGGWRKCLQQNVSASSNTFVGFCKEERYSQAGRSWKISSEFEGRLQICNIEFFGRPMSSMDCGQPGRCPFALRSHNPVNTHYGSEDAVNYTCSDGFQQAYNRRSATCGNDGKWSCPISCTWESNEGYNKTVTSIDTTHDYSLLTDGNISTCITLSNETSFNVSVQLGEELEVSGVSVVFSDSYEPSTDLTVILGRQNVFKTCGSDFLRKLPEVAYVDCKYMPVADMVLVSFDPMLPAIDICEIKVYGKWWLSEDLGLECTRSSKGEEYKGKINMTISGIPCQRWDEQFPHAHDHTDVRNFPDQHLEDAGNYCRNPNVESKPWCHTTDPDVSWQYCPVRECDKLCSLDDKGTTYQGNVIKTAAGEKCTKWNHNSVVLDKEKHFNSVTWKHRNCRNPLASQSRPWCYTPTSYGLCDIPVCPVSANISPTHWILDVNQTLQSLDPVLECLVWLKHSPKFSRVKPEKDKICTLGRVFNTTFLCFHMDSSGTIWKMGMLECVDCGAPPAVANATVLSSSSLLNSIATYTCLDGFVTNYTSSSASDSISCERSGQWQTPKIQCLDIQVVEETLSHPMISGAAGLVSTTNSRFDIHHSTEFVTSSSNFDMNSPVGFVSISSSHSSSSSSLDIDSSVEFVPSSSSLYINSPDGLLSIKSSQSSSSSNLEINPSSPTVIWLPTFTAFTTPSLGGNVQNLVTSSIFSGVPVKQLSSATETLSIISLYRNLTSTISLTLESVTVDNLEDMVYSQCACLCRKIFNKEEVLQEISKELLLNTKTLTSYWSKRNSYPDNRPSAQSMGALAVVIISLVVALIFLSDISSLVHVIKQVLNRR